MYIHRPIQSTCLTPLFDNSFAKKYADRIVVWRADKARTILTLLQEKDANFINDHSTNRDIVGAIDDVFIYGNQLILKKPGILAITNCLVPEAPTFDRFRVAPGSIDDNTVLPFFESVYSVKVTSTQSINIQSLTNKAQPLITIPRPTEQEISQILPIFTEENTIVDNMFMVVSNGGIWHQITLEKNGSTSIKKIISDITAPIIWLRIYDSGTQQQFVCNVNNITILLLDIVDDGFSIAKKTELYPATKSYVFGIYKDPSSSEYPSIAQSLLFSNRYLFISLNNKARSMLIYDIKTKQIACQLMNEHSHHFLPLGTINKGKSFIAYSAPQLQHEAGTGASARVGVESSANGGIYCWNLGSYPYPSVLKKVNEWKHWPTDDDL